MSFSYSVLRDTGSDDNLNNRGLVQRDYLDNDLYQDEYGKKVTKICLPISDKMKDIYYTPNVYKNLYPSPCSCSVDLTN